MDETSTAWTTAGRFAASPLAGRLSTLRQGSSRSNAAVAGLILTDPLRAATASIDDMAVWAGVSTATLSRFARALNFESYAEMRAAIADALQDALNPVEKLRGALRGAHRRPDEGLTAIIENTRAAAEGLSAERLTEAVRLLATARTIYVMGFGLSAHSAGHLVLGLQPFCPQVVNVVEFGGTEVAAGRLMSVGPGDVLVAITVPRYARDAVGLAAYARDRDAAVLCITDSLAAPITAHARVTLLAPASHPILPSSSTAVLALIETLVAALMTSSADNVARAEALSEAIGGYLTGAASGHDGSRERG